jgi:cobalt-zinc-cadmium efflux system membrane fusion protein
MNPDRPCINRLGQALSVSLVSCCLAFSGAVWAGPGAHGPNGEHLDAPSTTVNGSGLARLPDGSVNVPKIAQRRMTVRTIPAELSEVAVTTELPGRVVADPNASGRVQTTHGGRIEPGPHGLPVVGRKVQRGEILAYVRHHADPFSAGAQASQLAELRAQRQLAEQRASRLESLAGTVPRKEIDAARIEANSLAEREQRIGASLSAREAVTSPVDGVIARAELLLGQIVEPRDILFEIVDPTRLLVEASTGDVALSQRIDGGSLQGIPGVNLRLIGVARVMRDGVVPINFAVRPESTGVAPPLVLGQPVIVLARSTERARGIVLPAQAVARGPSNEPIVWIKSGVERFIPQPVQYRALNAGTVVITSGLSPENRVVVQGAALIAQIR